MLLQVSHRLYPAARYLAPFVGQNKGQCELTSFPVIESNAQYSYFPCLVEGIEITLLPFSRALNLFALAQ